MNENWRVGDLAECVEDDWYHPVPSHAPKTGNIDRVAEIIDAVGERNVRCYMLVFVDRGGAWECRNFRKLVQQYRPAEEEFTALIKRPVRKRERA